MRILYEYALILENDAKPPSTKSMHAFQRIAQMWVINSPLQNAQCFQPVAVMHVIVLRIYSPKHTRVPVPIYLRRWCEAYGMNRSVVRNRGKVFRALARRCGHGLRWPSMGTRRH